MKSTDVNYQLVAPHKHRVNAAEHTIRTFKNHLVAGMSSVHPKFPMYLWDELLPQAFITLNLLQISRTCPKISAYAYLYGTFDFDITPMAPLGVIAIIYNDPDHRVSYGLHGGEAFYLRPSLEHYRCYRFFFPSTGRTRVCATAQFVPIYVAGPTFSATTKVLVAENDIVNALKQPAPLFTTAMRADHIAALKKLAKFFETAESVQKGSTMPGPPQPATIPTPQKDMPAVGLTNIPVQPTSVQTPSNASEVDRLHTHPRLHHRPATHRYPTRARHGPQHSIDNLIEEHTINMCVGPNINVGPNNNVQR